MSRTMLMKRNDPRRRFNSFKKHSLFILQPFIVAMMTTRLWYWFYLNEIHFSHEDEVAITTAIITTLGITYSITASIVFASIWEKYQKVVICILKKDRETFLCYRDERIPIIIHILLLVFSMALIFMIGGLEYHHLASGVASVFVVSLALSLYFVVIVELQNPAKSLWLSERIPQEWLKVEIDKYFDLGKKH